VRARWCAQHLRRYISVVIVVAIVIVTFCPNVIKFAATLLSLFAMFAVLVHCIVKVSFGPPNPLLAGFGPSWEHSCAGYEQCSAQQHGTASAC